MIDNEMLDAMRDLLTPINLKLEKLENEIADIKHDVADNKKEISNLRLAVNRGCRKNNDEIQTLVAVLEAKNILPIAK